MTLTEIQDRLSEIAAISLQELEDDAVLALLKERKELLADEARAQQLLEQEKNEAEKQKQEAARLEAETKAKELKEKETFLKTRLAEVNAGIHPDQDDDKLLALIQERKVLEAELQVFATAESGFVAQEGAPVPVAVRPPEEQKEVPGDIPEEKPEISKIPEVTSQKEVMPEGEEVKEEPPLSDGKITITNAPFTETNHINKSGKVSGLETINTDRVVLDSSLQTTEYQGYLSELKENINSLGTFLQSLPLSVKRSRAFMLEVARIDPAYAMHYADKDTLKKDEAFNVAIAGMNNQRNTGNPLSEMLPELRTGAVLLAGVKNDFRNVRFARPEMPEYEEILAIAKKGALEAVASLKSAHDITFLLPPILQKDKAFMAEVEKVTQ